MDNSVQPRSDQNKSKITKNLDPENTIPNYSHNKNNSYQYSNQAQIGNPLQIWVISLPQVCTISTIMIFQPVLSKNKKMILIWLLRNRVSGSEKGGSRMRPSGRSNLMTMILLRKFRISTGKKRNVKCLKIRLLSNQASQDSKMLKVRSLGLVPITMESKTNGIKELIIFFLPISDVFIFVLNYQKLLNQYNNNVYHNNLSGK